MQSILTILRRLLFGGGPIGGATAGRLAAAVGSGVEDQTMPSGNGSEGMAAMNSAYEKLCEHLTSLNIGYWSNSDELSICADLGGDVGMYRIFARVDADDGLLQVFGQSPVRVPAGARPAIAETLARVNCGLKIGKFEMEYDQGDLRFQAAQILPDDELDDKTIRRLIGTTITMLNTYLPAVLAVIYGNELPLDAVRQAEPERYVADDG